MKLTFTFTQDQVNLIGDALSNLPFRVAAPILADMQQQAQSQTEAAKTEAAE